MKPLLLVLVLSALLCIGGCGERGPNETQPAGHERVDPQPIPTQLAQELEGWLQRHGESPTDYVLGLFQDCDVVLLGEQHRIRHDVLFVQRLIPRLHNEGIHVLATEFACRADQALIDSLLAAPEWNEGLAREILFRQFVPWGFQEYVDVLKSAWSVNRTRPDGTPPFRVIGVNNSVDYGHVRSEADLQDPEIRKLVGGGQTEGDWALAVIAEIERGNKVLCHCGIHHAFTGFRQPRVQDGTFSGHGGMRFGNHLRRRLGVSVVTVYLHAPWSGSGGYDAQMVHPLDGRLDAFMLARGGGPFAVGFDTASSPLAGIPIENAVYRHGHEPFSIEEFCEGWIYTKPVSEYVPVTYIEGWINERNVERARANAMNFRWREYDIAQLTEGCKSYVDDFRRHFAHLR